MCYLYYEKSVFIFVYFSAHECTHSRRIAKPKMGMQERVRIFELHGVVADTETRFLSARSGLPIAKLFKQNLKTLFVDVTIRLATHTISSMLTDRCVRLGSGGEFLFLKIYSAKISKAYMRQDKQPVDAVFELK